LLNVAVTTFPLDVMLSTTEKPAATVGDTAGSRRRCPEYTTSSAVTGEPSQNFASDRIVYVKVVGVGFVHDSAIMGCRVPSLSMVRSRSYARVSARRDAASLALVMSIAWMGD
jgi:hypothetical protein